MNENQNIYIADKVRKIERNYAFVRELLTTLERLQHRAALESPNVAHGMALAVKEIQRVVDNHVE